MPLVQLDSNRSPYLTATYKAGQGVFRIKLDLKSADAALALATAGVRTVVDPLMPGLCSRAGVSIFRIDPFTTKNQTAPAVTDLYRVTVSFSKVIDGKLYTIDESVIAHPSKFASIGSVLALKFNAPDGSGLETWKAAVTKTTPLKLER